MDALFGASGWWTDGKKIDYDITKIRYGKVIIMSDAKQYWLCNTLQIGYLGNSLLNC